MNYFKHYFFFLVIVLSILNSCNDLNLNPLSEPSSSNFYSSQNELELAVNDLDKAIFYGNDDEEWTDNKWDRGAQGNAITFGTVDAEFGAGQNLWETAYKAIARADKFLEKKDQVEDISESLLTKLEAETRFVRAYEYSRLVTHFGDVPFYTKTLKLNESYSLGRTNKSKILDFIYNELDWAADHLPESYGSSELRRHTKGDALGIKARTALYEGDFQIARDAAKKVIDLGIYNLYPDYRGLFLHAGETSSEVMMSSPRSESFDVTTGSFTVLQFISRNAGGYGAEIPTWSLVASYECTDGKPIDESTLYNAQEPFKNRDPRLAMTVVKFGTQWLNYIYQPHPDSTKVYSFKANKRVKNNDTRSVNKYASYTGFLFKKGVDKSWLSRAPDIDVILMRYAEILLTYAEAKIELNDIDQSVLNVINQVRARAYGVAPSQITDYPAITTTDQSELRVIIRRERRVEFALEGLRYMDLIRWRIAQDALTKPVYGLTDPQNQDRAKFPFPGMPSIDKNTVVDYSKFSNEIKQIAVRNFDKTKQYLWPIPAGERRVNDNLTQNPGY